MANPMGLMGANNPIFQVSQQRAQDASQNKNAAVQGIIERVKQQKQNELAAKLKVSAALMESKDPYYFQKGYEGMTGMMNIPADNDIMTHMEEIRNSWSELRKLEGKVDPQTFKGLVTETLTRYPGSAPEGMAERVQQASETNWLSQATQIPGLQKQGLLTPEQAAQGTQTALQGAGSKGQEVLAASLKATEKPEKDVNEFQTFKDSYLQSNPNATGVEVVAAYKKATRDRETYADTQILGRLVDKFNADPNVRAVEKMDEFSQLIKDAVTSGNPIAHSAIPTLMARASGEVGNLSEADKRPFGGSKALLSRLEQALTEMATGKRTEENMGYITQLADSFQNAGIRKKENLAKERSKQYSKAYRGKFTEEEIFGMLSPGSEYSPTTTSKTEALIKAEKPPVAGAKKAPDGKWYLEKNGKFFRVD